MVERSPEEEERYQASLDASKLLRPDTYELSLSDFAQIRVDLEFAAGELHALLTDETDADRKHSSGTP
jgi:hypothetical protein